MTADERDEGAAISEPRSEMSSEVELSVADVRAAVDALFGPAPRDLVEEQPPVGRPDSGAEEELNRTFPACYAG